MAGEDMLTFVDFALPAMEHYPPLIDWVRQWTNRPRLSPLTPEEWFEEGHGITGGVPDQNHVWIPTHEVAGEMHLWAPLPAVADATLEELLKARHKQTDTFHVLLIPRLMTPRWRHLFNKACDFSFIVSPGSSFWPVKMYEPLWVGIILPFIKHRPWCLRRAPLWKWEGACVGCLRLVTPMRGAAGGLLVVPCGMQSATCALDRSTHGF
jgi:hypothetical protein